MKISAVRTVSLVALAFAASLDFRCSSDVTGSVSVSIYQVLTVGIFLAWALMPSRSVFVGKLPFARAFPFGTYVVWALAVSLMSADKSMLEICRDIFVGWLLILMIASFSVSEKELETLIFALLAGVLVNAAMGMSQVAWDWPRPIALDAHGATFKESYTEGVAAERLATGMFPHPNGFALYLMTSIILASALAVGAKKRLGRFLAILICAFFLVNLYFTYGKGAILWTCAGMALLGVSVLRPKVRHVFIALSTLVAVVTVVLIVVYPDLQNRGGGATVATRILLWEVAAEVMQGNVLGFLVGGNSDAILSLSSSYSTFSYPNAHNAWLNQVVYFGLPGLALFAWAMFSSLARVSFSLDRQPSALLSGIWAATTSVFGYAVFEPLQQGTSNIALIAILVAVGFSSAVAAGSTRRRAV